MPCKIENPLIGIWMGRMVKTVGKTQFQVVIFDRMDYNRVDKLVNGRMEVGYD